jgi:hypothetical protein
MVIVALRAGFASFHLIDAPQLRLCHRVPFRAAAAQLMLARLRVVGLWRHVADWRLIAALPP